MNEQSVINIIHYIQQYPDVPMEELVKNILQTGYKMEDLKEALRRQNISPIVIPGYQEPPPPPKTSVFTKNHIVIIVCIIVVLFFGLGAFILFNRPKQAIKNNEPVRTQQQKLIEVPSVTPTKAINRETTPGHTIPTWLLTENYDQDFKVTDSYDIKVEGNVQVDLYDGLNRHTGLLKEIPIIEENIPLVQYRIQSDEKNQPNDIYFQTDFIQIEANMSEYFDMKFHFRDEYPFSIKIITKDGTFDESKMHSFETMYSNRTRMVIYQDIVGTKGYEGVIRFVPQSKPQTYNLQITDSSGKVLQNISPTYILNGQQSQDVTEPQTTMKKNMENGKLIIELTAVDDNSGIHRTEYSLDGWKSIDTYTGPISVDSSQISSISFASYDKAGNRENDRIENL